LPGSLGPLLGARRQFERHNVLRPERVPFSGSDPSCPQVLEAIHFTHEPAQRLRVESVQPSRLVYLGHHPQVLAEHLQLLRDGLTGDAELLADDRSNISRRVLTRCQDLHDPSPGWF
jgi:hypothetical protein